MNVKLISITPDAEKTMGYVARVSNPANQENPDVAKLLSYCIKHGHWSVFETATMTLEIETSRAIAAQILRHRSFCFQEFSQRYASPTEFELYDARRQDTKNRQNSVDDLSDEDRLWFNQIQKHVWVTAKYAYDRAIEKGIAKECARFLLPLSTQSRLYMTGNVRSWIHYIQLRTTQGTQKEHRDIALCCKQIFTEQLPTIAEAMEWDK